MKEEKEEIDTRPEHMKIEIEYNRDDTNSDCEIKISADNKKNVDLKDLSIDELYRTDYLISKYAHSFVREEIDKKHLEDETEIFLKNKDSIINFLHSLS